MAAEAWPGPARALPARASRGSPELPCTPMAYDCCAIARDHKIRPHGLATFKRLTGWCVSTAAITLRSLLLKFCTSRA